LWLLLWLFSPQDIYKSARSKANLHYRRKDKYTEEANSATNIKERNKFLKLAKHELRLAKKADDEAAEAIFKHNNKNRKANEVDLHGLHVSEAIEITNKKLAELKASGSQLSVASYARPLILLWQVNVK